MLLLLCNRMYVAVCASARTLQLVLHLCCDLVCVVECCQLTYDVDATCWMTAPLRHSVTLLSTASYNQVSNVCCRSDYALYACGVICTMCGAGADASLMEEVFINQEADPYVLEVDGRLDLSALELQPASIVINRSVTNLG